MLEGVKDSTDYSYEAAIDLKPNGTVMRLMKTMMKAIMCAFIEQKPWKQELYGFFKPQGEQRRRDKREK